MNSTARAAAERRPDPLVERIQREHELSRAYAAAKTLEERLELAGLEREAQTVRGIRTQINALFVDVKRGRIRDDYPLEADGG